LALEQRKSVKWRPSKKNNEVAILRRRNLIVDPSKIFRRMERFSKNNCQGDGEEKIYAVSLNQQQGTLKQRLGVSISSR